MTHFSFKVVQSSLDSVVSDSQQQKPLQTQRRAEARPKKHYLVWVHRWNQGSTKITKKTTFILTLICKLYLVGFFCLSFFLNPLLIHRNTHTHTELNIHKILLIQSLFIYLYDKMVKAPCRSMKSDKGVKKKKAHARHNNRWKRVRFATKPEPLTTSWMASNTHKKQHSCPVSQSWFCSFVILPPHCPPILS